MKQRPRWAGPFAAAIGAGILGSLLIVVRSRGAPADDALLDASRRTVRDSLARRSEVSLPESRPPKGRDVGEWQGMLVDEVETAPCERSEQCGLARSCVANRCVGCQLDGQCSAGEVCVLEHCIREDLASCRSQRDCEEGLCVLSGYTADPRGNGGMKAACLTPRGGASPPMEEATYERAAEPPIHLERLLAPDPGGDERLPAIQE